MRPIIRPKSGLDNEGKVIDFKKKGYQAAHDPMVRNWGRFCSYCELYDPFTLQVEHVSPKSLDPSQKFAWNNFLLGCERCNLLKSNKPTDPLTDFVWPDSCNTFLLFEVRSDGFVHIRDAYKSSAFATRAQRLIDLVQLNSTHLADGKLDPRYRVRLEYFFGIRGIAGDTGPNLCRDFLELVSLLGFEHESCQKQLVSLKRTMALIGLWSIWAEALKAEPRIIASMVDIFPGTLPDYLSKPPV